MYVEFSHTHLLDFTEENLGCFTCLNSTLGFNFYEELSHVVGFSTYFALEDAPQNSNLNYIILCSHFL